MCCNKKHWPKICAEHYYQIDIRSYYFDPDSDLISKILDLRQTFGPFIAFPLKLTIWREKYIKMFKPVLCPLPFHVCFTKHRWKCKRGKLIWNLPAPCLRILARMYSHYISMHSCFIFYTEERWGNHVVYRGKVANL